AVRGEAVPDRPPEWGAESRLGRGDAEVADEGEDEPTADCPALDHRDGGLGERLDRPDAAIDLPLVLDAALAGVEPEEPADVAPRDEGVAARAPERHDPDFGIP